MWQCNPTTSFESTAATLVAIATSIPNRLDAVADATCGWKPALTLTFTRNPTGSAERVRYRRSCSSESATKWAPNVSEVPLEVGLGQRMAAVACGLGLYPS